MRRPPAARKKRPIPSSGASDWVLVVDNDAKDLKSMKDALVSTDLFDVEACSSFAKAEESLRSRVPPVAIVTDLDMGMGHKNGANFLQLAQQKATKQGHGFWPVVVSRVKDQEALSACEQTADNFLVRTFSKHSSDLPGDFRTS